MTAACRAAIAEQLGISPVVLAGLTDAQCAAPARRARTAAALEAMLS